MSTWTPGKGDIKRNWYIIDADGVVLGRLASRVASILRGKHRPQFTPHCDCGDHVIVVNAAKVRVTGRKEEQKIYYRHSGYPGGLKQTPLKDMRARHPERIIEAAVRGMLPKNPLGRKMFKKLKVYAGAEHPHAAQKPTPLSLS